MLFPTIDFAIFFSLVFIGGWLLARRPVHWKIFMLMASYVFYGWWDWRFTLLLAASSAIAIVGAALIDRARDPRYRRLMMAAAVATDLSLLGWFKYYGFFATNVDNAARGLGLSGTIVPLLQVTLPVGVSFFTFMAVSYLVDVYRGGIRPAAVLDVAVYLSFFPHLVAGPIVRGGELLPQLKRRRDPRRIDLGRAAWLIFAGLFKKVVISSFVASAIVDPVFGTPDAHSSLEVLFAVYAYAVQIWADFSGYSDMAIGLALLVGIRFPDNFDNPYRARDLQEFWRRWHMTLSRWLRDYLYIPLGGNRGSRPQLYRNIMLTMLLGGLWHGAAWTFVAWGGIHGVGQVIGHARRSRQAAAGIDPQRGGALRVAWQRLATFHVVCLGWVFFRADSFSSAVTLLDRLVRAPGPAPLVTWKLVAVVLGAIAVQNFPAGFAARVQAAFASWRPVVQGAVLGGALLAITTLGPQGVAPFIYYRF